jgi:hypothetical protein
MQQLLKSFPRALYAIEGTDGEYTIHDLYISVPPACDHATTLSRRDKVRRR